MKILFDLVHPEARLPERQHENDVGLDVYAPEPGILHPGANCVDLGFTVEVPIGWQANIYPRGGHSKKGIYAQLPPIDPGYTGTVHALIYNGSGKDYVYDKHERLGQLVFTPVAIVQPMLSKGKERGNGAFNSTGK